jgi:hypothetical protein
MTWLTSLNATGERDIASWRRKKQTMSGRVQKEKFISVCALKA